MICHGQGALGNLNNLYQVQKGETVYSIASAHNLTVEELLAANPEIKKNKIKKGSFLVIPQKVIVAPPVKEIIEGYKSIKVGVVLPMEAGNELTPKMVEFYQGLLMAADSVRRGGTHLDIYAMNSGEKTEDMEKIINSSKLSHMDIIFGPAHSAQIAPLAEYCKEKKIRLVLPFSNFHATQGNPNLYFATASNWTFTNEAAQLLSNAYPNRNYIIVETGNEDTRGKLFTSALKKHLERKGISTRILQLEGDIAAYETAFNTFRDNCLIIDNSSMKSLNQLIAKLNAFKSNHPEIKISLQGYPEWQTYTNSLLKEFFQYDTYVYSAYYYNSLAPDIAGFQARFQKNFGKELILSYPRYGVMGYDLGFYFLNGLAKMGNAFEMQQSKVQSQTYQHTYKFSRDNANEAFVNTFVQLIHYTQDEKIELIR